MLYTLFWDLFPLTFFIFISLSEGTELLYYLTAAEFSILMYHHLSIFSFFIVDLYKFQILILLQQYMLQIKFPNLSLNFSLFMDLNQSSLL